MQDSSFSSFLIRLGTQQTPNRPARWAFRLIACFLLVLAGPACTIASAQTNEWTWMGGSVTAGTFGTYGTLGTPAAANIPGGRQQPVTWTDDQGNLWLFGGAGFDSVGNSAYLNDLWEFHPATGEWTWVGGSDLVGLPYVGQGTYGALGTPAAGNLPPGRSGAVGWTDANGSLWLFGGFSYGEISSYLNDLWEYNPSTNEWAWISGSNQANQAGVYGALGTPAEGNVPGGRESALSWTDSKGNLWLFGGAGYDSAGNNGNLNDLWEFNPTTSQWTWVSGANTVNQAAVGTLGTPAAGDAPGARNGAVGWIDGNGNFWLFGGIGTGSSGSGSGNYLNDLWEYNLSTNEWTWTSGISSTGSDGVYGDLQISAASNAPAGRTGTVGWTDAKGNLWMFGGLGFDADADVGFLNDLWEFSPSTSQWTWEGGSDSVMGMCPILANWCGQVGVYGTEQVPALGNTPGGRYDGASWSAGKGIFWLFGGEGIDSQAEAGALNDLWQFQPNTGGQPVAATPVISPGSGTYSTWQTVTIEDSTPGATIDYLINGDTPALEYTGPILVSSTETIEAIASATGYANSSIASASFAANLPVAATPTFSVAAGNYATAQTVTLTDTTPGATIYYAIGAAPTAPNIAYTGPISISASETLQTMAVAENYLNSAVASAIYVIGTSPSGQWAWMGGSDLVPGACSNRALCGASGWYGTLRVPAPSNFPGARGITPAPLLGWGVLVTSGSASTWTDNKGNLWLFGGGGYDSAGNLGSLNDLWEFTPATGEWTWMSGGNAVTCFGSYGCGMVGVYGTLGTPSANNTPGGRTDSASWTDSNGKLWLFGGYGYDEAGALGFLNDFWKFDPSTNQWTWMGGSETLPSQSDCQPGQYGTFASSSPESNPGGRGESATWTDHNGNFWTFGGFGCDSRGIQGLLNDLWEFHPATSQWSWMGGGKFIPGFEGAFTGVYGSLGVPAIGNLPASLEAAASWTDGKNNLWLFGGFGANPIGTYPYLNDMWEYLPAPSEWAWQSANSDVAGGSEFGTYGTMGDFGPANIPGIRSGSASWTDLNGSFWLLGGNGLVNAQGEQGWLNDLWEFNPSINQWRWMNGSSSISDGSFGAPGQYGTPGMPAPGNTPGSRFNASAWTDQSGNLWLFGGSAFDAQGAQGILNDLWEYTLAGTPIVPPPTPTASPSFSLAAGTYTSAQMLTISDQTTGATIYYSTNGTAPNVDSAIYNAPISVSTSETVEAVAVASGDAVSSITSASYTINLPAAATPAFSVAAGTYTSVQTVTLSDPTQGATIYYTTNGTTPTTSSTVYSGAIMVSSTETIQAIATATGYSTSAIASATYTINLSPNFMLAAAPASLTVNSSSQGSVTLTVTPQNGFNSVVSFACSGLPAGVSSSFDPATVTPSGSAVKTTLTFTASAQAVVTPNYRKPPLLPTAVLAIGICGALWKKRRVLPMLLFAVALLELSLLSACGGGGANGGGGGGGGGTQESSTVMITAASGSIQQTTTVTLTVN